jgi:hypothetical protein
LPLVDVAKSGEMIETRSRDEHFLVARFRLAWATEGADQKEHREKRNLKPSHCASLEYVAC